MFVADSGVAANSPTKREVSGQVFIVTKGGENLKLGLVGIHVIEEKELSSIASKVQRQAATNRANQDLLKGLEKEIQDLAGKAPRNFISALEEIELSVSRHRFAESMKDSPAAMLFRMLPPVATQTDADGTFVVEASETDWIAARSQRLATSSIESYLWVMPVGEQKRKLLVSNDRMLDDDELLRTLGKVSPVATNVTAEASLAIWASEQRKAVQVALAEARASNERAMAEAESKAIDRQRLEGVASQPQSEYKAVEAKEAGALRRKPIKRLAEAMEERGIIHGEKMLKQGETSRLSILPSFDVKNTPFGEYDLRMVAAVQERWLALLEGRHFAFERKGKVVLKFRLHADGSVSQVTTAESNVGEVFSFTCEAAVVGASPFGRWPSVLKAKGLDPREITLTFQYY